jgi:hypothetical protein
MDLCSISKQRKMSTKFHASNRGFDYKWAPMIGRVTRELLEMQRLQWGIENENSQRYKRVKRSSPNPGVGLETRNL